MRFHQAWTSAAAALCVLSGAAFADVTVSHSNDPTLLMGSQMASLFGAEHKAFDALPEGEVDGDGGRAKGCRARRAESRRRRKADKKTGAAKSGSDQLHRRLADGAARRHR